MSVQEEIDQLRLQAARDDAQAAHLRLEAALLDNASAWRRQHREWQEENPPGRFLDRLNAAENAMTAMNANPSTEP